MLTTSKVLLGTKVVTKVTRGTQARHTLVPTLDTVHRVTKVPLTEEATPTHPTKVVAILATVVVHQATQAREATRTTSEL
jgi:ornithine carbamoyltransferase